MQGPPPGRKTHSTPASNPTPPEPLPATDYSREARLLQVCWLVLGTLSVLVFGFVLLTMFVKGPNSPSTAPDERRPAQNQKQALPTVEDNEVNERQTIDPKPAESDRPSEVERILGKSFHPLHPEDTVTLADSPPLAPPSSKTSSGAPSRTLPTPELKREIAATPSSTKPAPANRDAAIEQRLQASEDDLRKQLLAVPEMRLFSDLAVEDFRKREENDERAMKGVPKAQIEFAYNMQMNQYMQQAGLKEGLPLLSGANCQLDPGTASIVQTLSKTLRSMGFVSVPGTPPRTAQSETAKEKLEALQEWCDVNSVEKFRGGLATLLQVLQVEDVPLRLLLVRELTKAVGPGATAVLANRAMVDASPEVRQAAVAALEKRPAGEYVPVLLKGLRYPWPPVADYSASALRKLKPEGAVPKLVDLLDLPDPALPVVDKRTQKPVVRELVRLNHMRHCLLCHVPSANDKDGLVRGLVPTPGKPLPKLYYASQSGDFVRADITFLRQDFSQNLPVGAAAPWPKEQRFDFVTRVRPAKPEEIAKSDTKSIGYPQREAVLYALRGITGKDGGDFSKQWRKRLDFTTQKPKAAK